MENLKKDDAVPGEENQQHKNNTRHCDCDVKQLPPHRVWVDGCVPSQQLGNLTLSSVPLFLFLQVGSVGALSCLESSITVRAAVTSKALARWLPLTAWLLSASQNNS